MRPGPPAAPAGTAATVGSELLDLRAFCKRIVGSKCEARVENEHD
jgi:hypothetical protein